MMGWAEGVDDTGTGTASWVEYRQSTSDTSLFIATFQLPPVPHALQRPAQLEELARLASADRHRASPRERARFGWHDAPRRPCYRAPRLR
jgi:hypothetical protein